MGESKLRNNMEARVFTYEITINGKKYIVEVGDVSTSPVKVIVNGESKVVEFAEAPAVAPAAPATVPSAQSAAEAAPKAEPVAVVQSPVGGAGKVIVAPMPGKIMSIRVKPGNKVTEGDTVCTLEAMKMEMPISSTTSGVIQGIHVNVGDSVAYNDPLVTVA